MLHINYEWNAQETGGCSEGLDAFRFFFDSLLILSFQPMFFDSHLNFRVAQEV